MAHNQIRTTFSSTCRPPTPSFTFESGFRVGSLDVGGLVRVGLQDVSGSASAVVSTSTSIGLLGSLGSGDLSGGLGSLGLLGRDGSLDGGRLRAVVCEVKIDVSKCVSP